MPLPAPASPDGAKPFPDLSMLCMWAIALGPPALRTAGADMTNSRPWTAPATWLVGMSPV